MSPDATPPRPGQRLLFTNRDDRARNSPSRRSEPVRVMTVQRNYVGVGTWAVLVANQQGDRFIAWPSEVQELKDVAA